MIASHFSLNIHDSWCVVVKYDACNSVSPAYGYRCLCDLCTTCEVPYSVVHVIVTHFCSWLLLRQLQLYRVNNSAVNAQKQDCDALVRFVRGVNGH
jgi:hypothetical protein